MEYTYNSTICKNGLVYTQNIEKEFANVDIYVIISLARVETSRGLHTIEI